MNVCPVCGAVYSVAHDFCPMDGSPLQKTQDAQPSRVQTRAGGGGPPHASTDVEAETLVGRVLDQRYRLDACIGSGGMGVVYRATHVVIRKPVAVKILRTSVAKQPDIVRRFLLEARLASNLEHPNVVDISDFGEIQGIGAYYVMEFLPGHTLADEIDQNGKLAPKRALDIAVQIAEGLGAAHANGIVHRDLKPDNVFLCPSSDDRREVAKLLDFGIARVEGRKTRLTAAGTLVGTPEYMSPEQAQGGEVDHRSDLYSLGAILFEMLAGAVPFRGETAIGTLTKQMFEAPPSLRDMEPSLSSLPRIEAVIHRLLAKDAEGRPPSAADAIASLHNAAAEDLEGRPPQSPLRSTVAIGSDSMGVSGTAHAVGARHAAEPERSGFPPRPTDQTGAEPHVPASASTPGSESHALTSPAEQGDPRGFRSMASPPVTLVVVGAAMFSGLITAGVVGRMNRAPEPASKQAMQVPAADPVEAGNRVTLRFESKPPGADVLLGGKTHLGKTPFTWETDRSDGPTSYLFRLPGHADTVRQLPPDRDRHLAVELVALPAPKASESVEEKSDSAPTSEKGRRASRTPEPRSRRSSKGRGAQAAKPTSGSPTTPPARTSDRGSDPRPQPAPRPPSVRTRGDLKNPFGPN
jgi:serine/threonine-protein kinase